MAKDAGRNFHVSPEQANQTLSAVLRARLEGQPSWGAVRRLMKERRVTLNGNVCLDPGRRLRAGEVIKVLDHPTAASPSERDVRIRYLDAHLVVVEKPSGMTSVRHAEEKQWSTKRRRRDMTLEDVLPRIIAKMQTTRARGKQRGGVAGPRAVRSPPVRPVHRLDRDTSGLMVFARTVAAERHLGAQFRAHTTQRRYQAIVAGRVSAQTIETQLVRDRGDGRRGSTPANDIGKRAVTHVKPLEWIHGYTLVECRLETGRTHQIRIHLSERGHPVLGERVYNQPTFAAAKSDKSGAPRLALHALELGFIHPGTNEPMSFTMPLPTDLRQFLDRLRSGKKARSAPAQDQDAEER